MYLRGVKVKSIIKGSLIISLILSSNLLMAGSNPSTNIKQFCSDRKNANFVKGLADEYQNLIAFRNHGGLLNGGVCWWHSRFQRNAFYLTIFKPNEPRPTQTEAEIIIKEIRKGDKIVTIPGYRNFRNFTIDFANEIQTELEKWQKNDGMVKQAWVKGLKGGSEVSAERMQELMDKIFDEVNGKNNIAYNKLQIPGIDAHAWLVIDMKKEVDGYTLKVLDSNFPANTENYRYRIGDTSLNYHGAFRFVPYLENTKEMERINSVIQNNCQ